MIAIILMIAIGLALMLLPHIRTISHAYALHRADQAEAELARRLAMDRRCTNARLKRR